MNKHTAVLTHRPSIPYRRCVNCAHVSRHEANNAGAALQLAAWVGVGSASVTGRELRRFLEQRLPAYMIPTRIVCLDRLTLTANGKLDDNALAALETERSPKDLHGPLDEIEENLLTVWKQVLGLEHIGVTDNYFSLGGDSLRVIQLVHQARRYGIQITATDVLRYQTIRKVRVAMQTNSRRDICSEGVPAPAPSSHESTLNCPSDLLDAYAATAMQKFVLQNYGEYKGTQGVFHIQDCFFIRDEGFSVAAIEIALRAIINRHPALRTVFDVGSREPTQWVRRNLNWKLAVEDISTRDASSQERRVAEALNADRTKPFAAEDQNTALFRASVFIRSESEFNLIFSCHHAIMDGWGHRILLNQLLDAYARVKSGAEIELGAPDSACKELALFLQQVSRSSKAAEFWRQYLSGVELCNIEPHVQRGPFPDDPLIVREISARVFGSLVRIAREQAVSLQALLLSAWLQTMRRASERESVAAGVVVNGRSEHLTDPLSAVGLFWNIVPVVSRSHGSLLYQAGQLQKDLIDMHPYSGYPLAKILAEQGCDAYLDSTFRYVNFWNTAKLDETLGLRVLGGAGRDLYPFPLNCSAALNSIGSGGYLRLDYLETLVPRQRAVAVMDDYAAILEHLAQSAAYNMENLTDA